ncbi:hypothetical protein ACXJJ3_38495 [Kribbella sp. WER1]
MRILVLHREGGAGIGAALRDGGFTADVVDDRAAAERALHGASYHGLVTDDLALVISLRPGVPVLMLTAGEDGAALVQYGVDDSLVWPAASAEIVDRVRSICREPVAVPAMADHGVDGSEYAVLELLLRTPGAVVTRARLERACGADVDEVVARLRERVALRIEAVRGIGFRVDEAEVGRR